MANLTIQNYSRTASYSLPNGQIQGPEGANANVVSINLISQNAPDYTIPVNENFLYLLENFASTTGGNIDGPDKAIQGQLWYDTSSTPGLLKINDSTIVDSPDWQVVSPQIAGNIGEIQFNDGLDQLAATNNMTYVSANATLVVSNVASTGNASVTGELLVSGNANVTLNLKVSGNAAITGNTAITGNATVSGTVVATGNVTGGNLRTTGVAAVTGNVTGGNLLTAGNVTAKGSNTHVQYNNSGNLTGSSAFTFNGSNVNITGNVIATGNVNSNNANITTHLDVGGDTLMTGNLVAGNIRSVGGLTVTGNMSAKGSNTQVQYNSFGDLAGSSAFTFDGANVAVTGRITGTGNVTGGNLVTGGILSVTGNATVTGNLTVSQSANIVANLRVNSALGVGTAATANTGEIVATGNIIAFFSDDRLKTRLGNIENALDKVSTLATFYFEPNETAVSLGYSVGRDVGISAQELQAVLPEAIGAAPISNNYLAVKHDRITPLLIAAIKELHNEVNEIKKKIG